jgi:hypothetical protein
MNFFHSRSLPLRSLAAGILLILASSALPVLAATQGTPSATATPGTNSLADAFSSSSPSEPQVRTFVAPDPSAFGGTLPSRKSTKHKPPAPFSRIAVGADFSPLGFGGQVSTNINPHFNLRLSGNAFNYTASNIGTEGFNVNAKLNLASAGASLDIFPFGNGFRLSPGLLFYNGNQADAAFTAPAGTSFTLNDHTYYSGSGAQAIQGQGSLGLGNGTPAFTLTTGWGNVIPAKGGHLSFPVEIGVAFTKAPTFSLALSGNVCDAQGQNCVNVATDPTAQADLTAQVQKYQNDLNPLRTYPIVSFGVAYNFRIR